MNICRLNIWKPVRFGSKVVYSLQGFALRVRHSDIGTEAFPAALTELLGNGSYAAAAKAISVKLRARKRTPVQEAVGAYPSFLMPTGKTWERPLCR